MAERCKEVFTCTCKYKQGAKISCKVINLHLLLEVNTWYIAQIKVDSSQVARSSSFAAEQDLISHSLNQVPYMVMKPLGVKQPVLSNSQSVHR